MFDGVGRHVVRIGLALLVGAVFQQSAIAQVPTRDTSRVRRDSISVAVPLPGDSARADSARARQRADSVRAAELARRAADSVKAPLAHAEVPPSRDIGERYRWTREDIFSSGALTLGELLGRIPGFTSFASGWVATPHTNTYLGDFGRIRLFYDGVELDPLDLRIGPMHDCAALPMWTLEELGVERAAEELRVYMRSWRVQKTTPYTRVDVSTGDLSTNAYRGFFGRRFGNGGALQLAAQQYSTEDPRNGGDGDHLGILGRVGWAKKQWSVDVVLLRTRRSRTVQKRDTLPGGLPGTGDLPGLDAVRSDAYARLGYGDPDGSRWFQLIAATSRFSETNEKTNTATPTTPTTPPTEPGTPFAGDSVDTTATRAQYIATAGTRLFGASVSATARLRVFDSFWFLTPSARIGYERGMLSLTAYAEQQMADSTFRGDLSARLTPLPFLSVAGSVGRSKGIDGGDRPASLAYRGEVGVRLGRLWATGGVMSVDTSVVPGPIAYDTLYRTVALGSRRATFGTLRGKIWKDVGLNVVAHKWPAGVPYTPEYQVRSELYASTSWLSRFPQGNFHILASVTHEYRTGVLFPTPDGAQQSSQYRTISTLLELRLYEAVISWGYRNILGEIYQMVPGYLAPRAINYYGVRWDFFN